MSIQLPLPGLADLPFDTASMSKSLSALWSYPDVPPDTLCKYAKMIGAAGEALVDSLLLRVGLTPLALPEALPSDRLILHPERPISLQVKTCTSARNGAYSFAVQRGYHHSPNGLRNYEVGDFDLLACVALPANAVLFTAGVRASCRILLSDIPGLCRDPMASLEEALLALGISSPASLPDDLETSAPWA